MTILIRGGDVVSAEGVFRGDVAIREGTVVAVGRGRDFTDAFAPDSVIDATGTYVLPGLVDSHVHLDMVIGGTALADDFDTGTAAALAGGTTTIVDFAFQSDSDILGPLASRREAASARSHADYGFHVVISDPCSEVLDQMGRAAELGVCSFKAFMAYPELRLRDDQLLVAMRRAKELGVVFVVHAENGDVADLYAREALEAGNTKPEFHGVSRPPEVEAEATRRAIEIARWVGAPLFVFHVTCREALAAVEEAQIRDQAVYAETCIQYLVLDREQLKQEDGAKFVCSPPLRGEKDRRALWSALANGTLQVCSTDHCAFDYARAKQGCGDFTMIPNGLPTIEDRLTVMFELGVERGLLALTDIVRVCSRRPAEIFGMYPRKGTLAPGADADVAIFDPNRPRVISASAQHMNVDYNPFEGLACRGSVRTVLRRGEIVYDDGQLHSRPGQGRFVERQMPGALIRRGR